MKKILVVALILVLWAEQVSRAALTATPVFVQTPQTKNLQITAVATPSATVYTGGTNGSKIIAIYASNTDTIAHVLTLWYDSTTGHCVTSLTAQTSTCAISAAVSLPASSGAAAATPVVNLMNSTNWPGLPIDSDGNPFLFLPTNTSSLEAMFASAISTAGSVITVTAIGADF